MDKPRLYHGLLWAVNREITIQDTFSIYNDTILNIGINME